MSTVKKRMRGFGMMSFERMMVSFLMIYLFGLCSLSRYDERFEATQFLKMKYSLKENYFDIQ
jgi:hypothetical protein